MRRRCTIPIVLLNILILLGGCTRLKQGQTNNLNDLVVDDYLGANMELTGVTPESTTCVLINNSEMDLYYGDDYYIQVYREGEWYYLDMADGIIVDLIAHTLLAGSEKSIKHDWTIKYGEPLRVLHSFL